MRPSPARTWVPLISLRGVASCRTWARGALGVSAPARGLRRSPGPRPQGWRQAAMQALMSIPGATSRSPGRRRGRCSGRPGPGFPGRRREPKSARGNGGQKGADFRDTLGLAHRRSDGGDPGGHGGIRRMPEHEADHPQGQKARGSLMLRGRPPMGQRWPAAVLSA